VTSSRIRFASAWLRFNDGFLPLPMKACRLVLPARGRCSVLAVLPTGAPESLSRTRSSPMRADNLVRVRPLGDIR
jgi:hypothetical protein